MIGITAIIELIKTGFGFFVKDKAQPQKTEDELETDKMKDTGETNREEIKQGKGWRNSLGYILTLILLYNYVVVPVLAFFGIVVFTLPISDIIRLLVLLISGN